MEAPPDIPGTMGTPDPGRSPPRPASANDGTVVTNSPELRCHEVLRRLDDYLDRELALDEIEAVERHLEACAQCAREARSETAVLQAVRDKLRRVQIPPDLAFRIHGALSHPRDPEG
jgi:anti-sigma factor (TIGR02949 family)